MKPSLKMIPDQGSRHRQSSVVAVLLGAICVGVLAGYSAVELYFLFRGI